MARTAEGSASSHKRALALCSGADGHDHYCARVKWLPIEANPGALCILSPEQVKSTCEQLTRTSPDHTQGPPFLVRTHSITCPTPPGAMQVSGVPTAGSMLTKRALLPWSMHLRPCSPSSCRLTKPSNSVPCTPGLQWVWAGVGPCGRIARLEVWIFSAWPGSSASMCTGLRHRGVWMSRQGPISSCRCAYVSERECACKSKAIRYRGSPGRAAVPT